MKRKKIFKIVKITAIVLASVLAVSAAGVFVAFNFVIKPKSQEIIKAVDEILKDDEIRKAVEPYLKPGEAENILKSIDESSVVANAAKASPAADEADNNAEENNSKTAETEEKGKSNTPAATAKATPTPSTKIKSRSEYNNQYDYVKDNIPSSDFSKGMALASRVDMGYISGLLSGGLTSEEKRELKSYLTSHFSSSEIAEGISLYSKYSYLLR